MMVSTHVLFTSRFLIVHSSAEFCGTFDSAHCHAFDACAAFTRDYLLTCSDALEQSFELWWREAASLLDCCHFRML